MNVPQNVSGEIPSWKFREVIQYGVIVVPMHPDRLRYGGSCRNTPKIFDMSSTLLSVLGSRRKEVVYTGGENL